MQLVEADIQRYLNQRRPGQSSATTERKEPDCVKILSGVLDGVTTGTPIGLLIENTDQRPGDYSDIKDKLRPSHADYTYLQKYGIRDHRGGGRASARETAMRVAAGAIARKYLSEQHSVVIRARLAQMGDVVLDAKDWEQTSQNAFFCAAPERLSELQALIDELREQGDSVGALLEVQALNVPVGLGEPVFDKLDALLAQALMSINAVKAVEIGEGFRAASMRGSQFRDELDSQGFKSNTAGGSLGGISSGQPIVARLALKPTSSIRTEGKTLNTSGKEVDISVKGRHDPCVGIRAAPIAEAMVALVLMDLLMRHRAQNQGVQPAMDPVENAP